MNLIYLPDAATGQILAPDENEFHHLQVLRMAEGASIHAFDGRGNLYTGILTSISKKGALVSISELIKTEAQPAAKLHIAIAPTKNIERLEWFIEKATEIGIETITPILCQRSERRELRIDRLEKVILSAAKQSLHLHLPKLNNTMKLNELLKGNNNPNEKKFIAYCEEKANHLKDSFAAGDSIRVLIGPEGDFTDEEVSAAKAAGFTPVSLGESRLRTETAGVMVSAIFAMK